MSYVCGLPWSSAGESGGEERWDENWYQNLRAALNGLIESFNTSVQAYTQGEHEQYRERELPPHAHAHNGHHLTARSVTATTGSSSSGRGSITNLIKSKGMSKVSIQYVYTVYTGAQMAVITRYYANLTVLHTCVCTYVCNVYVHVYCTHVCVSCAYLCLLWTAWCVCM